MQPFHQETNIENAEKRVWHFFKQKTPIIETGSDGKLFCEERYFTFAAVIDEENGVMTIGKAVVNPKDKPNRKIGYAIALGRAKKLLAEKTDLIPIDIGNGFAKYCLDTGVPPVVFPYLNNIISRYLND